MQRRHRDSLRPSRRTASCCVLLGALSLLFAPARAQEKDEADRLRLAIVQPGYPGSPRAAEGFLNSLREYLERRTGLEGLELSYHNVPSQALKELLARRPQLGVVSLGFYLKHRKEFGLRALLEAEPPERFYVLVAKGSVSKPQDLEGAPVAGGPLYEVDFLARVAFRGRGVEGWKAVPTLRVTRALRGLERGEYRAVVVTEREYHTLEELGRLKALEKLLVSEYYPVALVVVFGARDRQAAEEAVDPRTRKLAEAFAAMASDEEAKSLLATMGCKGFRPVQASKLEKLERLYDEKK